MLAGKNTKFTINFLDGKKFVGKLATPKHLSPCAEGDYLLVGSIKGEKKTIEGWVNAFKPTPEYPDIIQYVTDQFAKKGRVIERVEIKEKRIKKGGKKWAGVFFSPSK